MVTSIGGAEPSGLSSVPRVLAMDPALSGSEPQTVIGKWLDEGIGGGMIRIYRENGKRYIEFNYKDGSSWKTKLVKDHCALGRVFEPRNVQTPGTILRLKRVSTYNFGTERVLSGPPTRSVSSLRGTYSAGRTRHRDSKPPSPLELIPVGRRHVSLRITRKNRACVS